MTTIRVRDWTKERIEEIREAESHSSHDSVIKTLLKDRELVQRVHPPDADGTRTAEPTGVAESVDVAADAAEGGENRGAFADLTVVAELETADNGVLFLWCPNCGHEIAHLGVENPVSLFAFEAECQRCLTRLDQHGVVGIEIGYPIEQRLLDDTLGSDLRRCVVDYWDRTIEGLAEGSLDVEVDDEHLVWQFGQYAREFSWDWPADVPVIGVETGRAYVDRTSEDRFEVVDRVTENRHGLDTYRVRRFEDPDAGGQLDDLEPTTLMNHVLSRSLYLDEAD